VGRDANHVEALAFVRAKHLLRARPNGKNGFEQMFVR
jgi:hypothetical protein